MGRFGADGSGASGFAYDAFEDVKYQECGCDIARVAKDEVDKRIKAGRYVRGNRVIKQQQWGGGIGYTTQDGVWDICRDCAREDRAKLDLRGAEASSNAQAKRIQARLALIRERRRDLTLEQAVSAAVNDEFDAHNEPNPGFRAYLLERAHLDADERSLWRKFRGLLRELFGSHEEPPAK